MLNFFDPAYQESPINDSLFGLCDNEDGNVAFTDTDIENENNWIATVENPEKSSLTFTAIDKGVIKDEEYNEHERCDGMLTSENHRHLYFVELKNKRDNWISKGILQLESTIKLFDVAHPGKKRQYIHKKAYVCNKKHPHFHFFDNELNRNFFRTYRFRIDIQAKIAFEYDET